MRGRNLPSLGIPSEQEYVQRYSSYVHFGDLEPFHFAFALFRLAVIFEGIAARAKAGTAASQNAGTVGQLSAVFARRATELIDENR